MKRREDIKTIRAISRGQPLVYSFGKIKQMRLSRCLTALENGLLVLSGSTLVPSDTPKRPEIVMKIEFVPKLICGRWSVVPTIRPGEQLNSQKYLPKSMPNLFREFKGE